jgi:hypothetical protein
MPLDAPVTNATVPLDPAAIPALLCPAVHLVGLRLPLVGDMNLGEQGILHEGEIGAAVGS